MTIPEYFKYEDSIEGRAEYWDGEVRDVADVPIHHSAISANTVFALHRGLKEKEAIVFTCNLLVFIEPCNCFLYPDSSVILRLLKSSESQGRWIADPNLLIEVVTEESVSRDLGAKFEVYRQLPSLQDYILIDSQSEKVVVFHRQSENAWNSQSFEGRANQAYVPSIGLSIPLREIYRNIALDDRDQQLL